MLLSNLTPYAQIFTADH